MTIPGEIEAKSETVIMHMSIVACEQALLFGRVKRVSRELARLASLAQIGELARRLCQLLLSSLLKYFCHLRRSSNNQMGVMTTDTKQYSYAIQRKKYHKHGTTNMDKNEALRTRQNKLK